MEEEREYKIEEAEEHSDDREFMLDAIKHKASWVLAYASERLLADRELMLKAVEEDGQALYYASQELRDDKEVVLKAVQKKWLILKYASKRLRGDKDVVMAAITQSTNAGIYLTDEILKDKDVDLILNPPQDQEEGK